MPNGVTRNAPAIREEGMSIRFDRVVLAAAVALPLAFGSQPFVASAVTACDDLGERQMQHRSLYWHYHGLC
jgi:hypothetical protein